MTETATTYRVGACRKNGTTQEWEVPVLANGVIDPDLTYFAADKEDAVATREAMIADLADKHETVVTLVACAAGKHDRPMKARDLYDSQLFTKAKAYAEAQGRPWFILSAKHYLLDPDEVIAPYDVTLKTFDKDHQKAWAWQIEWRLYQELRQKRGLTGPIAVEFIAGDSYRKFVVPALDSRSGIKSVVPMKGLGIGKQLQWLKNNTNTCAPNHTPTVHCPECRDLVVTA